MAAFTVALAALRELSGVMPLPYPLSVQFGERIVTASATSEAGKMRVVLVVPRCAAFGEL